MRGRVRAVGEGEVRRGGRAHRWSQASEDAHRRRPVERSASRRSRIASSCPRGGRRGHSRRAPLHVVVETGVVDDAVRRLRRVLLLWSVVCAISSVSLTTAASRTAAAIRTMLITQSCLSAAGPSVRPSEGWSRAGRAASPSGLGCRGRPPRRGSRARRRQPLAVDIHRAPPVDRLDHLVRVRGSGRGGVAISHGRGSPRSPRRSVPRCSTLACLGALMRWASRGST